MKSTPNKKFCLIGHPLSHSMSKFIHTELFKLRSLPYEYDVVDISPETFNEGIEDVFKKYYGVNVTIPYKNEIIQKLDAILGKAKIYSSVNTLKIDEGVSGYNTDCEGFLKSLESRKIELFGRVIVLGSGGVARTFAYEAALAGCEVVNVCQDEYEAVSKRIGTEIKEQAPSAVFTTMFYNEIEKAAKNGLEADFIINATPVGMFPKVGVSPVSGAVIGCARIVYDAVYNPRETEFMRLGAELGKTVIGGMDMLAWQAEMAQRIWFGDSVSDKNITKIIEAAQSEMERMFL